MSEKAKVWRRVSFVQKASGRPVMVFDGVELTTRWVRFLHEFEDGYARYQKGQVIEMADREKMAFYLEAGHCEPCQPNVDTPVAHDGSTAKYVFTDSVVTANAAYAIGQAYTMPCRLGDKYESRGLCYKIGDDQEPIAHPWNPPAPKKAKAAH